MAQSVQIQKVNWWHERLADIMIANPHCTLGEIARALNKSQAWISIVKNSDAFIDYWKIRSKMHSDAVTGDIKAKGFAAAELALDRLHMKLEGPEVELMTVDTLLNVVDVTMKRFGYSQETNKAPVFNFNLGAATPEQLAAAREKLRSVDAREVVDVKPLPANGNAAPERISDANSAPDKPDTPERGEL